MSEMTRWRIRHVMADGEITTSYHDDGEPVLAMLRKLVERMPVGYISLEEKMEDGQYGLVAERRAPE